MKQLNISDAKAQFSALVDRASRGRSFVIAKSGLPLAMLVPLDASRRATIKLGLMRGKIRFAKDFDAQLPKNILKAFGASKSRHVLSEDGVKCVPRSK